MSYFQGFLYLMGVCEVMEEMIELYSVNLVFWKFVVFVVLLLNVVQEIVEVLVGVVEFLVIVGFIGCNYVVVEFFVLLVNIIKGFCVFDIGCFDMCFFVDYFGWLGMRYGVDSVVEMVDVMFIFDCDVLWINKFCKLKILVRIFYFDVDFLKEFMLVFYIDVEQCYCVDVEIVLK